MNAALIVAAGQGKRMGADLPKQYLKLAGKPILFYTLKGFDRCTSITHIILTAPEADLKYCQNEIIGPANLHKPVTLVAGGTRRQDSVYNGLNAMAAAEGVVSIHDGVRPFFSNDLINACITGANKYGACIPAIPVFDTLKRVDTNHRICATLPRDQLYMAQTPQTFRLPLIIRAHAEALRQGWQATDDASLVERMGEPVHIVQGLRENLKITTPEDLAWAEDHLKIYPIVAKVGGLRTDHGDQG
jgi:2-C-methyl-D-erythritol 4-phosphate cytidylyltransferase